MVRIFGVFGGLRGVPGTPKNPNQDHSGGQASINHALQYLFLEFPTLKYCVWAVSSMYRMGC